MSSRQLPTINLSLHPKQETALRTKATECLYGGAAGGGKSFLMRCAAIIWCASVSGLQVYLFRRVFPDLIKNHMEGPKGFRQLLAPWVAAGFVTIVEEEIRFWNGSRIFLCHCKDEKDRFKYQGAEIHVLLMDELTHFTETIYRFLRTRCRAVGLQVPEQYAGCFPRILAGSNPGNIGHSWVKKTFVDAGALTLRPMNDNEGGMLRQFIPARLDDNPSMKSDDPTYRARLRGAGSEALVKALEDGDWNVIDGAFFDCWSTERHVVQPFAVPGHWTRFLSMDWGYAAPFAIYWWAVVAERTRVGRLLLPRGCMVAYREWYGEGGARLTAEQVAAGILHRERQAGEVRGDLAVSRLDGEKASISYGVIDPSAYAEDGGPSIAERMAKAGVFMRRADNRRVRGAGAVGGWDHVRQRLKGDAHGNPMLVFFEDCRHAIRTIPVLQHDDANVEDLDTEAEDHAADSVRYGCASRPYLTDKPDAPQDKLIQVGGQSSVSLEDLWEQAPMRRNEGRV